MKSFEFSLARRSQPTASQMGRQRDAGEVEVGRARERRGPSQPASQDEAHSARPRRQSLAREEETSRQRIKFIWSRTLGNSGVTYSSASGYREWFILYVSSRSRFGVARHKKVKTSETIQPSRSPLFVQFAIQFALGDPGEDSNGNANASQ